MSRRAERHGRHKQDWGTEPARSDQVREAAAQDQAAADPVIPLPARQPSRKDTRTWCKGKPGRQHQVKLMLHTWGWSKFKQCGWQKAGRWVYTRPAPVYPRGMPIPKYSWRDRTWVTDHREWRCLHQYQCQACGKWLGTIDAAACPDRPRDD